MLEIIIILGAIILAAFVMTITSRVGRGLDKSYFRNRWTNVEKTMVKGETGLKLAIIDADKLVDHALKQSRVRGESMGERLKQVSYLKSIDGLWTAHKLRNKLVHEQDKKLKKNEAKYALSSFKKALRELGAI